MAHYIWHGMDLLTQCPTPLPPLSQALMKSWGHLGPLGKAAQGSHDDVDVLCELVLQMSFCKKSQNRKKEKAESPVNIWPGGLQEMIPHWETEL